MRRSIRKYLPKMAVLHGHHRITAIRKRFDFESPAVPKGAAGLAVQRTNIMKKSDIIEKLKAAGVEPAANSTVAELETLAAQTGISLVDDVVDTAVLIVLGDEHYAALCQSKVAAGLSLELATEVTARQRAEDEAAE